MAGITAKANRYNFLIAFFVALGSFTYGYNSSVTASVIGLPSFFKYFDIDPTTSKGSSQVGAINGVFSGGGALGCWTLAWLADYLGRTAAIQIICGICIVSAALQAGSVHIAMFLVSRLLNGFGIGMINCVVPIYQSEVAPATQRGRLVGIHGFLIVTGYVRNLPLTSSRRVNISLTQQIRVVDDGRRTVHTLKTTRPFNGVCHIRFRFSLP